MFHYESYFELYQRLVMLEWHRLINPLKFIHMPYIKQLCQSSCECTVVWKRFVVKYF